MKVTKSKKREADQGDNKSDVKVPKPEDVDQSEDSTYTSGCGPDPLYVADFKKLGPAKSWKKKHVNQAEVPHNIKPKTWTKRG